ncbi:hypothetical protein SAMN05444158_1695 [Bradyrhizobium canariense]|uniref:Uncharacterized protein n=2 Tax=Bradyrhizobium canariense TaxID=255045 RepID=A0A1H1R910_9BRAD|nr:hypothetical protein SAMN05444158_1695 [Bradyrhizobium canariense]
MPAAEFDLCIVGRGESRRGRLIWCHGPLVGVVTDQADVSAVVSIETARLVRKLKADRTVLAQRLLQISEPR